MDQTTRDGTRQTDCHSLLYASTALFPPPDVLLDIVRTAERENAAQGLSGMLCYSATRYIQLLEGPRPAIDRLWRTLCRDLRHRILWTHRSGPGPRTIPALLPMGYASEAQVRDLGLPPPPSGTEIPADRTDAARLAGLMGTLAARLYPATCGANFGG